MNPMTRLAQLLSADSAFRQAFLDNPDKAIAAQGWTLDAETMAVIANVRQLLATAPGELTHQLFHSANIYGSWGGFTLENERPAAQPL
jgi:hypothetical protein